MEAFSLWKERDLKKVLVTGFEPFGGAKINPALEAIKRLDGEQLNGGEIVTCQVPVTRFESTQVVVEAIEHFKPDYVITLGQAAGRAEITPERIAINIDDYRIPDNAGNQPIDQPIVEGGPAAYFSTLPIKAITKQLQQAGIACQVSNSAGTFVCNHLFYGLQHYLVGQSIPHGFVHIPLVPEQDTTGSQPVMPLDIIVDGLKIMAQTVIQTDGDIEFGAGEIC